MGQSITDITNKVIAKQNAEWAYNRSSLFGNISNLFKIGQNNADAAYNNYKNKSSGTVQRASGALTAHDIFVYLIENWQIFMVGFVALLLLLRRS